MMAAMILAAVSCKDDDDDVNIIYVDGNLNFSLPEYIHPNEGITFTPRGLSHPDGKEIGYCWKVTPTDNKYDTTRFENGLDKEGKPSDGSFFHEFSDTMQIYTVYCSAFAEGYTSSSKTKKTTVVIPGPGNSITNSGIDTAKDPYITVDGNRFYYTTIDGLDWFKQDLCFTESGVPFKNAEAMDGVYGLFYNYESALTACPEGWRLPSDKDWVAMANAVSGNGGFQELQPIEGIAASLMVNADFNGARMWTYWPAVGEITNSSGLCMIPTGYANLGSADAEGKYPAAKFEGVNNYAAYWTADKVEGSSDRAYFRYIYCEQPDFVIAEGDTKSFGAAVRCVRKSK